MRLGQLLAWPCLLVGFTATATPILLGRGVVNHDSIQLLPESLPHGTVGVNMKKFQPYFNTEGDGCWPYPAINDKGDISGGLKPIGPEGGDCQNSVGQVYVRWVEYRGHHAFMYAWFLPKNENGYEEGYRYDWQTAVVWVDDPRLANAKIQAVCASHYNTFDIRTDLSTISFKDSHPLLGYYYSPYWEHGLHYLGFTTTAGGLHPAVEWSMLTPLERSTLDDTDWNGIDFPLGYNHDDLLKAAFPFLL